MEVIFKGVNEGKTTEAMKLAAAYGGNVLFASNEMSELGMVRKFFGVVEENEFQDGEITFLSANSAVAVLEAIDGMEEELLTVGERVDLVVLDMNFGIMHSEWFDLATDLEKMGFAVVVTQQLARAKSVDGKTPVVKR